MSELKPCPFCGCRGEIFSSDEVGYPESGRYTIKCVSCMCGTGYYKDPIRASEAWNRRVENASD